MCIRDRGGTYGFLICSLSFKQLELLLGRMPMEQEITLLMPVEAIQPDSADYDEWEHKIQEYRREFLENGDTINGSRGLHHYEKIAGWLEQIKACEKDNNSYIGVPATTFLAIRRDSPDAVSYTHLDVYKRQGRHIH